MSFETAVTGVNAAQTDLNVVSNNIANVGTTGFKNSRAEFADIYSNAFGSVNKPGMGATTARIHQLFTDGQITQTGNPYDMAISGNGFFVVKDAQGVAYTRAGAFGPDSQGYLVTAQGQRLQGFAPTANGTFDTGRLVDLQLPMGQSKPQATTQAQVDVNLAASDQRPTDRRFDPNDPQSYNYATSTTVYDSLGNPHTMTLYYVKVRGQGFGRRQTQSWGVHAVIDGDEVTRNRGPSSITLHFDQQGRVQANSANSTVHYRPGGGAAPMNIALDLTNTTAYDEQFSLNAISQNGRSIGNVTGVEIDKSGVISARYSDGSSGILGQVALANFANPEGLQPIGDTQWAESGNSGPVLIGQAGNGNFGSIASASLEGSNVDLVSQLVDLIMAQRNFQANTQSITTWNNVTQAILNVR
jgi:flagellar hook protein FlgE